MFQVDPVESTDWVKFRLSPIIEAYGYNTDGTSTKLAIVLLLAYCLVSVIQRIYAGISKISSTCRAGPCDEFDS